MLRHPGAVHMDIRSLPGIDIVHDIEKRPWPVQSESFDKVLAIDVLEHLNDVIGAVEECHRVLRPGGLLFIHTTYWNTKQSFTDPTHKHFFTENSFDFFCPGTMFGDKYGFYSPCKFKKNGWRMDGQEMIVELTKA